MKPLKCPHCNKVLFFRCQYDQRRVYNCTGCGTEVVIPLLINFDAAQQAKDAGAFL